MTAWTSRRARLAEKASAWALFCATLLHLPAIFLLVESNPSRPPFLVAPVIAVGMTAAWGSAPLIEGRRTRLAWTAHWLCVLEAPVVTLLARGSAAPEPPVLALLWAIAFVAALGAGSLYATRGAGTPALGAAARGASR